MGKENSSTTQYDLYGGVPPHSDVGTSREAALSIAHYVPTLREEVYAEINSRGAAGATDDEIEMQLRKSPSSLRPRRRELFLLGRVADSGERRQTRSGRTAKVWVAQC